MNLSKRLQVCLLSVFRIIFTFAAVLTNPIDMTANERYEKTWNEFLVLLNRDSRSRLAPFLKEKCVNARGMRKWMEDNSLGVQQAKQKIRMLQAEALKEPASACASNTGALFLPVEVAPQPSSSPRDMLSGVSLTFPDGTLVSIKTGSAAAVMSFLKLYQKEELVCLG